MESDIKSNMLSVLRVFFIYQLISLENLILCRSITAFDDLHCRFMSNLSGYSRDQTSLTIMVAANFSTSLTTRQRPISSRTHTAVCRRLRLQLPYECARLPPDKNQTPSSSLTMRWNRRIRVRINYQLIRQKVNIDENGFSRILESTPLAPHWS